MWAGNQKKINLALKEKMMWKGGSFINSSCVLGVLSVAVMNSWHVFEDISGPGENVFPKRSSAILWATARTLSSHSFCYGHLSQKGW